MLTLCYRAWFPIIRLLEVILDQLKMFRHLSVRDAGKWNMKMTIDNGPFSSVSLEIRKNQALLCFHWGLHLLFHETFLFNGQVGQHMTWWKAIGVVLIVVNLWSEQFLFSLLKKYTPSSENEFKIKYNRCPSNLWAGWKQTFRSQRFASALDEASSSSF